jgi:probable addiction module antidote protein
MAKQRQYRTIDQIDEEYYRNHPDEIDSYLAIAFEEYTKDGCTPALLSSLRMIARVKGISALASKSGLTRNGIQKALAEEAKPGFDTINAIVKSMGYGITVQRLDMVEEPISSTSQAEMGMK